MKRFYDVIRQLEQESERTEEMMRRFVHAFMSPADSFWEPHADVYETREAVKVRVEIAGVRAETIHVELSGDGKAIAVRGRREDERADAVDRVMFHQMEIYLGEFERVLALPPDAEVDRENVEASYRDGILLITLPKRTGPTPQTVQIPVTG